MAVAIASQEKGFIPTPDAKGFLPDVPHKNSSVEDALRSAKEWGCVVKLVNGNDFHVCHPLSYARPDLFPRQGLAVSRSRHDAPQALVAYLRKVEKAVKEETKVDEADDFSPAPAIETAVAQPEPALRLEGVTHNHAPAPTPAAPVVNETDPDEKYEAEADELMTSTQVSIEEATTYLTAMASATHFREHIQGSTIQPFEKCQNPGCKEVVRVINGLRDMRTMINQFATISVGRVHILRSEARSASEYKAKLENEYEQRFRLALAASEKKVDAEVGKEVLDSMPIETRREKLTFMLELYRQKLLKAIERSIEDEETAKRYATRIYRALGILMKADGYRARFEDLFKTHEWGGYRSRLMAIKCAGGGQMLIGKRAWDEFLTAMEYLKQAEKR